MAAVVWWFHDTLPYSELQFFPKRGAFDIGRHEGPKRTIYSYITPREYLTRPGVLSNPRLLRLNKKSTITCRHVLTPDGKWRTSVAVN